MNGDAIKPLPVTLVIFGGGGDLAHRKLLPALYNLHLDGLLPTPFAVVGVGRTAMSDDEYRAFAKDGVQQFSRRPVDEARWQDFAAGLFFAATSIDESHGFAGLGSRLDVIEHETRGLHEPALRSVQVRHRIHGPRLKGCVL